MHFVWLLKETVGVISDILRLGSECVVSLILGNMHSSPWWPWAEPSDHICTHNPPIYRIKGKSSVWLCSVYQLRSSCKRVEKRNKNKKKSEFWLKDAYAHLLSKKKNHPCQLLAIFHIHWWIRTPPVAPAWPVRKPWGNTNTPRSRRWCHGCFPVIYHCSYIINNLCHVTCQHLFKLVLPVMTPSS